MHMGRSHRFRMPQRAHEHTNAAAAAAALQNANTDVARHAVSILARGRSPGLSTIAAGGPLDHEERRNVPPAPNTTRR